MALQKRSATKIIFITLASIVAFAISAGGAYTLLRIYIFHPPDKNSSGDSSSLAESGNKTVSVPKGWVGVSTKFDVSLKIPSVYNHPRTVGVNVVTYLLDQKNKKPAHKDVYGGYTGISSVTIDKSQESALNKKAFTDFYLKSKYLPAENVKDVTLNNVSWKQFDTTLKAPDGELFQRYLIRWTGTIAASIASSDKKYIEDNTSKLLYPVAASITTK